MTQFFSLPKKDIATLNKLFAMILFWLTLSASRLQKRYFIRNNGANREYKSAKPDSLL